MSPEFPKALLRQASAIGVNAGGSTPAGAGSSQSGSAVDNTEVAPGESPVSSAAIPTTGPESIAYALKRVDLGRVREQALSDIKSGKKTYRPDAIRLLGYLEGFKRSGLHPADLVINAVPVIPPKFRPFSVAGDTFLPGDANELYRDLINVRDMHGELEKVFGQAGAAANKLHVYDAVKAVYGYGEPVSPKTKERGVSGFLAHLIGSGSPKGSFMQAKVLAKNQDYVGRGVATVDPTLGMDEIGIPDEMAWKLYAPYIQRRLVRGGIHSSDAVKMIRDRDERASHHLDAEIAERPVIFSRAPSWHKFNVVGANVHRIKSSAIAVNPFVTTGSNLDFDGDSLDCYTRLRKDIDIFSTVGQADEMINAEAKLDLGEQIIHIKNFPHLETTRLELRPGVTEFDVPANTSVYALNRETFKHEWLPVTKFSIHENLSMWFVKLSGGKGLLVSDKHSLVAYRNGVLDLCSPSEVYKLCIPRIEKISNLNAPLDSVLATGIAGKAKDPAEFNLKLNRDTGLFVGLLVGDGCVTVKNQVYLYGEGASAANRERLDEIVKSGQLPYDGYTWETTFDRVNIAGNMRSSTRITIADKAWFNRWLKEQIGDGALNKQIPDFSLNASDDHLWGILDGLISTDGSISLNVSKRKKPQLLVSVYTSSTRLVLGVQTLLTRLGIRNSVSSYTSPTSGRPAFVVSLSTTSLLRKHRETPIHFNHPTKNAIFQANIGSVSLEYARGEQVPYPQHLHTLIQSEYAQRNNFPKNKQNKSYYGGLRQYHASGMWSRGVALRELESIKHAGRVWGEQFETYQRLISDRSIAWEQVTSSQMLPSKMTGYDLTVPGALTFALDDGTIVNDTLNVHLPSTPEAVNDTKTKLMPSKMLFSIKDPDKIVPVPKQENILGLWSAQHRKAKATHNFKSEGEALKAIQQGKISLSDEVNIPGIA